MTQYVTPHYILFLYSKRDLVRYSTLHAVFVCTVNMTQYSTPHYMLCLPQL